MSNSFGGSSASCPACNGTGRRSDTGTVFRDVTKTKPSHFVQRTSGSPTVKSNEPTTFTGAELAKEIRASALAEAVKTKLILEIVEHEGTHGKCTQTFTKKIRKQLKP